MPHKDQHGGPMQGSVPLTVASLQERLQLLFAYVHPAEGGPYSVIRVADLVSVNGVQVSANQIQGILDGRTQKPSFEVIAAMAAFFKVPINYFSTTDQKTWDSYLNRIKRMNKRVDYPDVYAERIERWYERRAERRARRKKPMADKKADDSDRPMN